MSLLEKRYALDVVEKSNLQKTLDSMQYCIKVTSRQGLVERLDCLTRQLGLKLSEDTSASRFHVKGIIWLKQSCLIIKRQPNNYGFKHPWPYFLISVSNRSILINEHSCCIGYSVVFNDLSCPWKKLRIFGKAKFRWNEVNNPKQKRIKK
ncbi:hypothetical protein pipiens_015910 [Culex pipiens pipiens]|uniref:Uncharacterized protein n=1 Tax=Culex pipiens pipiens TaxID=38569 RepID=A0ABD1CNK5_CULPP